MHWSAAFLHGLEDCFLCVRCSGVECRYVFPDSKIHGANMALFKEFNSPPYILSLQCPSYSKFSQLSYEPGCSHELWCRKCATWLWNTYVLIFSKTLFYTHIPIYILSLLAQNAIKQYKWYFSRQPLCQGLRKCKIGQSTIILVRTTPY